MIGTNTGGVDRIVEGGLETEVLVTALPETEAKLYEIKQETRRLKNNDQNKRKAQNIT